MLIKLTIDPDTLFGRHSGATEGLDCEDCFSRYEDLVTDAVLAEYPKAKVETSVHSCYSSGVQVISDDYDEEEVVKPIVEGMMRKVRDSWDWVVCGGRRRYY
jgi:hypothetical protein